MAFLNKQGIIEKYGKNGKDTGSLHVQIALMTARIEQLSEHFKTHKKDNHSKRGLLQIIATRKKFLNNLQKDDANQYKELIAALGLRK